MQSFGALAVNTPSPRVFILASGTHRKPLEDLNLPAGSCVQLRYM